MAMPVDDNPLPAQSVADLPDARRLLGMVSRVPYDPKAKVPDVLVRKLHEVCVTIGLNVMIGYEIDEMRTVEGYLEYLGYLNNRLREARQ